jgi:pyruvate/2-oxoglutarate/acetoin dehydrogenase E1 component
MAQAIRSDNPVVFFEHVLLYNVKGEVRALLLCFEQSRCLTLTAACVTSIP